MYSCPNLKYLSFHGSFNASEDVLLKVVQSFPKLELVDFSDSPYFTPEILQEMEIYCPNIRGIRWNGFAKPFLSSTLIKFFPGLKLLHLSDSSIGHRDLLTLVTGNSRLEYSEIMRCQSLMLYMYTIKEAHCRIAEIFYDWVSNSAGRCLLLLYCILRFECINQICIIWINKQVGDYVLITVIC